MNYKLFIIVGNNKFLINFKLINFCLIILLELFRYFFLAVFWKICKLKTVFFATLLIV